MYIQIKPREIGERIQRLLDQNHISVFDFANELQITPQSVYKWIRGDSLPDIYKLAYIGKRFNVSLDNLILGGKTNESCRKECSCHR